MKLASATYPLSWLESWQAYEDKISAWVAKAAGDGADLLVFPEYGAMELAALDGPEAAGSPRGSIDAVAEWLGPAVRLFFQHWRRNTACISCRPRRRCAKINAW